jgi:NAD(P)-dependent dehydrogenase (short-subunit alcohol dehydrogenase family)
MSSALHTSTTVNDERYIEKAISPDRNSAIVMGGSMAERIRFNPIAPGVVNTPMHAVEAHEFLKQLSPMKRLAEVDEVADLLLYMEAAPFLKGAVVHLDGGAHAGKWA